MLWVVGALALILLGAGGVVVWQLNVHRTVSNAPQGPATSASDAVAGYLQALADGSVDDALARGQSEPSNRLLLTDEVLAASRELGPISNIEVTRNEAPDATEVKAHYEIGVEPVDTTVKVTAVGDEWRLLDPVASLTVNTTAVAKGVPVQVNGVTLTGYRDLPILPGRYRITTDHPRVDYADHPEFLVAAPGQQVSVDELPLTLSEEGRTEVLAAARDNLTSCLARKELAPEGCPFAVSDSGVKIVPASIRWTLVNDPFSTELTEEWSSTRVSMATPVIVRLQATTTTGSTVNQELTFNTAIETDPVAEDLTITWR